MAVPVLAMEQDQQEARRFLALLDESADTFCFRAFDDDKVRADKALARKFNGTLEAAWPMLQAQQAAGCGVYVVANAGQHTDDTIYRVRCVFADTDGAELAPLLACGLEPHVVVESSPGNWHVYWLVDGLPIESFKDVQLTIAARFGTDTTVNNLSRVMRLPGSYHLKGAPFRSRIIQESGALPYSAEVVLNHFASAPREHAPSNSTPLGQAVEVNRHEDVLKCTLLLGKSVRSGAMTRTEALAVMYDRRVQGRWSRPVPDDEIERALDGAIRAGGAVTVAEPTPELPNLVQQSLRALTLEDIDAARTPHPHAFFNTETNQGLFPEGEVTVIGAPGREGKTTLVMAVAMHYALGWPLGGLSTSDEVRSVLIYSAEDDRSQYARKAGAQHAKLPTHDRAAFLRNLIVPDLHGPELAAWREIVRMDHRAPVRGAIVDPLIDAVNALHSTASPPGLVIFETASTLSDAEEDNAGHKVMIAALKHFATRTGCAVVLVHHTSQAAANNLPDLAISEADIRGGTTLVANARQTHLVVNLGSHADPFPDSDARTLLRALASKGDTGRVAVLVPLSSSKCADPSPVFFRWEESAPFGPRMVEVVPPVELRGKSWRAVRALLSGARQEAKADKKAEQGQASVRLVVQAVVALSEKGEQATSRQVSIHCGRSFTWAKPYLDTACELGELVRHVEQVPRSKGLSDVYRPAGGALPWHPTPD